MVFAKSFATDSLPCCCRSAWVFSRLRKAFETSVRAEFSATDSSCSGSGSSWVETVAVAGGVCSVGFIWVAFSFRGAFLSTFSNSCKRSSVNCTCSLALVSEVDANLTLVSSTTRFTGYSTSPGMEVEEAYAVPVSSISMQTATRANLV